MTHLSDFYVIFRLQQQAYALPLEQVQRALRMVALTPVVEAPLGVSGLLNLAGKTLPAIDLRLRFGLKTRSPQLNDRLLILSTPTGQQLALMVDEVCEVLERSAAQVEPLPPPFTGSQLLTGALRINHQLALILDTTRLAPAASPETRIEYV